MYLHQKHLSHNFCHIKIEPTNFVNNVEARQSFKPLRHESSFQTDILYVRVTIIKASSFLVTDAEPMLN